MSTCGATSLNEGGGAEGQPTGAEGARGVNAETTDQEHVQEHPICHTIAPSLQDELKKLNLHAEQHEMNAHQEYEYRQEYEEIKARTMYKMIEDVSDKQRLLFLTNHQAFVHPILYLSSKYDGCPCAWLSMCTWLSLVHDEVHTCHLYATLCSARGWPLR